MIRKLTPYLFIILITAIIIKYIFGDVLFNLNSSFFCGYGDGIKNYYTLIYHILYEKGIYSFGLNYPYGELITYTDGQPLLYFITKTLHLANSVEDGILIINSFIILSLFVTPIIIFAILKQYKLPDWYSCIIAIFIAFTTPQIGRIISHYALSYTWIIPLVYLLYILYFKSKKPFYLYLIILVSALSGLIHPYYSLIFFFFFRFNFFCFFIEGIKKFKKH